MAYKSVSTGAPVLALTTKPSRAGAQVRVWGMGTIRHPAVHEAKARQHRTKAVLQKALGVIDVWLFFMIRASVVAWDATQDMRVAVLVEG